MASEKLLKATTVVVAIVGIPLAILFWWEAYRVTLTYPKMRIGFIITVIFAVLVSVGGSIAVFLIQRPKEAKPK